MKKIQVRLGVFFMLSTVMLLSSKYIYGASDTTTSIDGNSSYTRSMGASACASFYVNIKQNDGEYAAQLKDPTFWHSRKTDTGLDKGYHISFKRTEGSKNAHWRGWVKNGSITVTI